MAEIVLKQPGSGLTKTIIVNKEECTQPNENYRITINGLNNEVTYAFTNTPNFCMNEINVASFVSNNGTAIFEFSENLPLMINRITGQTVESVPAAVGNQIYIVAPAGTCGTPPNGTDYQHVASFPFDYRNKTITATPLIEQ